MKQLFMLILASFLAMISACTNSQNNTTTSQQESASLIYTAAALTEDAEALTPAAPTMEPKITANSTLPPTSTPEFMVSATITADLVNLRSGPGTFFSTLATLPLNTQVTTLGMVDDGSWIKVRASILDGSQPEGWVFASLLDLTSLGSSLPIVEWPAETTISGVITDLDGNPINAVRVAASIQTETGTLRSEANSNRSGYFYLYTPPELTGLFNLEIVAVNCSSNISEILPGGSCVVQDYYPVAWRTSVSLPQSALIRFTYEQGAAFLEGKVVYQDGNGASQILIKAVRRSDRVESEFVTPQGGAYRLPLGLGTWDVVAIRFLSDGTPLFSETRVYEIKSPGQLVEPLLIPYTEIIER